MSPILFNILLGDITRVQGVQYFEFADYVAISYSGSDQEAVVAKIEAALIEIVEWTERWGQVVSSGKTKPMYFTNKWTHPRKLTSNDVTFEYIQKHKFLGMYFDSPKLTWSKHIEYFKGSSNKSLSIMISLSSNTWGADRKILLHYYIAAIRNRIDNGCRLYDSALETIVHQLTVMQNQCVRMALGARNTTPIISLLVEANIEPLDIRRKFLAIKYYSKLMKMPEESPLVQLKYQHTNNFKEDNSFFARANKYIREWQLESIKRDPIPVYSEVKPWEDLPLWMDKEFELEDKYMSSLQINNYFKDAMNIKYRNCLQIYTDGSKNDFDTTAALVIPERNVKMQYKLHPQNSILAAEIYAIHRAVEWVKENRVRAVIYTDSQSALILLSDRVARTHQAEVFQVQQKVVEMNENLSLQIQWIPGHKGIEGNEAADKEAKLARGLDRSEMVVLSYEEQVQVLKKKQKEMFQNRWESILEQDQRGNFLRNIKMQVGKWEWANNKSRAVEVALTRLRVGHVGLASYLFRFGMRDTPLCACGERETVQHFIMECQKYNQARNRMMHDINKLNINQGEITLKLLLGGEACSKAIQYKIIKHVGSYLMSTGRLHEL